MVMPRTAAVGCCPPVGAAVAPPAPEAVAGALAPPPHAASSAAAAAPAAAPMNERRVRCRLMLLTLSRYSRPSSDIALPLHRYAALYPPVPPRAGRRRDTDSW